MTPRCPNNHPNRPEARFCQTCGAPLRQPAPLPVSAPVMLSVQLGPARAAAYVPRVATARRRGAGWGTGVASALGTIGGLAVLAAFFMGWIAFSLPAVNFLLGPSAPVTISGYDIFMMGPGTYRSSPVVLVLLIPALGAAAFLLAALEAVTDMLRGRLVGIAQIILGIAGLAALAALLTVARQEPQHLLSELGLKGSFTSLLSAALVRVEPAPGFALNALGFILILLAGVVTCVFPRQKV